MQEFSSLHGYFLLFYCAGETTSETEPCDTEGHDSSGSHPNKQLLLISGTASTREKQLIS